MSDYTISLEHGKYTIIKYDLGGMEFRRHGEAWPAADDLKHVNVVRAMHDRIEELEKAIRDAIKGSQDPQGARRWDGMEDYLGHPNISMWHHDLRTVLEKK